MKEEHDYKELGLVAGLEIHQQLNTNKLFCNCPSILRSDKPIKTIKRTLNPVVGESGKTDIAAIYESKKNKEFNYLVYDTNCLVELDEEPPHEINKESLKITLQIAHLLNCKIFPVSQIMRKTVIDGSNTSGFQRTVMIAYDGFIQTKEGLVGIESIALEEDSARKIKEKENTFSLDRLGIPLVEITTKPDLRSPEQIKEAALKIGEILRSCDVKRGIGTIRQDLNISIKKSNRVEIKGFQDPKTMIDVINKEITRQIKCVKEKNCKKEVRRALPSGDTKFLRPMPGSSRMYPETDTKLLKISKSLIDETKKNLPKLLSENKGYLKEFGINEELIKLILKEEKLEDFKTLLHSKNDPDLVAKMLTIFPKEISIKEKKKITEVFNILNNHILEEILQKVDKEISRNEVKKVMQDIFYGKSLKEAIKKEKIDLEKEIKELIKEKPGLSRGAYMGLLMKNLSGKISGKEINEELNKFL